jgi:FKBP-type peptidyl-prolyl cis-trans isomerase FklB
MSVEPLGRVPNAQLFSSPVANQPTQTRKSHECPRAISVSATRENKKAGEAFLAENKTKEGVITLPSGLQYKILKSGDGNRPLASDFVICKYDGMLINGKEVNSSHTGPEGYRVDEVIRGLAEALQLMPVGSKWELFIPPDLAYGDEGAGKDIEPNSTLIFQVELLSIFKRNNPDSPETH